MTPPKTVYIALGSNQGNRFDYLEKAIAQIYFEIGRIVTVSAIYETPALGFAGNKFYNAVAKVKSRLPAEIILRKLLEIETFLGRERSNSPGYHNRTIDLDIIFYADEIIATENLKIPHPELKNRRFVLTPLLEIAPEMLHPIEKKNITTLLRNSGDTSEIKRLEEKINIPTNTGIEGFNFIAVEGNIGAGKTSFATMISQDFNAKLILERFKDNPFLPKFYEDKLRYAFSLEMSFLAERYQQITEDIAQYDLFKDFVISDYDIYKSLIFARITLSEEEFALYKKLFHIMYKEVVKPDLYLYLYQKPEHLLKNIKKRGREYEKNIGEEYLENINKSYLSFIQSEPRLPVKIIDITEMDFVNNRRDYLKILEEIREFCNRKSFI